jgi:hypothetical protein
MSLRCRNAVWRTSLPFVCSCQCSVFFVCANICICLERIYIYICICLERILFSRSAVPAVCVFELMFCVVCMCLYMCMSGACFDL